MWLYINCYAYNGVTNVFITHLEAVAADLRADLLADAARTALLTDCIRTDPDGAVCCFCGVLVFGVIKLASAALAAGVIAGCGVAIGVAVMATGAPCWVGGVCSSAGGNSGDT